MVEGCSEPIIRDDVLLTLVDDTIVAYPLYAIPYKIASTNIFNRNQPSVRQDKATRRDTCEISDFGRTTEPMFLVDLHGVLTEERRNQPCSREVEVNTGGEHLLHYKVARQHRRDADLELRIVGEHEGPVAIGR